MIFSDFGWVWFPKLPDSPANQAAARNAGVTVGVSVRALATFDWKSRKEWE